MALEEFSTQASVEARASEEGLLLWTDKDGDDSVDATTLTQGFQEATAIIFGYLQKRFGSTELASWTLSDCPALIPRISDALCIGIFSGGNYAQNPNFEKIYNNAITMLKEIRAGDMDLYGATESTTQTSQTEKLVNELEDPTLTDRTYNHFKDRVYF
jgi:phage gp36-like protein